MDPIDDMAQPFTNRADHTFTRAASAAFTGAVVGSMLDNTRFGRWFNTSRFIGFLGRVILFLCLFLAGVYIYEVIKIW